MNSLWQSIISYSQTSGLIAYVVLAKVMLVHMMQAEALYPCVIGLAFLHFGDPQEGQHTSLATAASA